eukprot:2203253-Pyramimonas_sp.AAC.1
MAPSASRRRGTGGSNRPPMTSSLPFRRPRRRMIATAGRLAIAIAVSTSLNNCFQSTSAAA